MNAPVVNPYVQAYRISRQVAVKAGLWSLAAALIFGFIYAQLARALGALLALSG